MDRWPRATGGVAPAVMVQKLLIQDSASEHALEQRAISDVLSKWVEYAATAIELLAIVLIVSYIFLGTASYLVGRIRSRRADPSSFEQFRAHLARSLLLGLEILVAADVVRTVTLELSIRAVAALGLLVLIRTFLSWSVVVELEGRWPWQARTGAPGS